MCSQPKGLLVIRRFCAFVVLLFAASVRIASAHAYIVTTQPAMNGSYPSLPASIAVSFDEPVTLPNADALEVVDDTGLRVDRHNAHIDPNDATRVIVDVRQNLPSGIYTVRWRVISADTHVVHGTYQLGVGGLQLNAIVRDRTLSPFDPSMPAASLLRFLSLLGAILAVGAFALQSLVLRVVQSDDAERVTRRAALVGTALVLIAAIPALAVQAAAVSGQLGSALPETLGSRWGIALIVRVVSAAALLLVAAYAWRRGAIVGSVAAAALLASFSASGHAVGLANALVDFVHIVAAAIWIGGVVALVPIIIKQRKLAAALFARFTPVAMVSVAVIVASGIYATVVHIPSFSDFVGTLYGRILLAKIALVAVLLGFGYRHWQIGRGRAAGDGSNTLGWEAIIGVTVIALTAVLIGQMLPMHMMMER
jgi:copper transport protein